MLCAANRLPAGGAAAAGACLVVNGVSACLRVGAAYAWGAWGGGVGVCSSTCGAGTVGEVSRKPFLHTS